MTEEYCLICCLLSKPECKDYIITKIKPEYIQDNKLRDIYNKIIELKKFNAPILAKELNFDFSELFEMENKFVPYFVTKEKIDCFAYKIFEDWKNNKIRELLNNDVIDVDKVNEIRSLQYSENKKENISEKFLRIAEQQFNNLPDEDNYPTGFDNIDEMIKGFRKSECIFIGGRPASGKSTLAMNIAYNMAKNKNKVLFCSIEMSAVELHTKLVKSITGIADFNRMSSADMQKIIKTSRAIEERLPLIIYDKSGMTIEDIYVETRTNKPDVLFIDHLSILGTIRKDLRGSYEKVSYLSGKVRELSREFNIPVICLCQLNRALEGRELKVPTLADLRDSGSIEQDGNLIAFVYRPEYHIAQQEPDSINIQAHEKWEELMRKTRHLANFIVAKNRRGLTGRCDLRFDGAISKFSDLNKNIS